MCVQSQPAPVTKRQQFSVAGLATRRKALMLARLGVGVGLERGGPQNLGVGERVGGEGWILVSSDACWPEAKPNSSAWGKRPIKHQRPVAEYAQATKAARIARHMNVVVFFEKCSNLPDLRLSPICCVKFFRLRGGQ